jgi:hypothetical protein
MRGLRSFHKCAANSTSITIRSISAAEYLPWPSVSSLFFKSGQIVSEFDRAGRPFGEISP